MDEKVEIFVGLAAGNLWHTIILVAQAE